MKKTIFLTAIAVLTVISCKEKKEEQSLEIHQASDEQMEAANSLQVEVDNKFDPICGMETAGHVSDTIHYEGKIYGFCSSGCKEEFAKNPESYLAKLNASK